MNEVKRFMRYVLPGFAIVFELLVALKIARSDLFDQIWKIMGSADLGQAALFIFFAGGIGYIFSILYFGFSRIIPCILFYNHVPYLHFSKKGGRIDFYGPHETELYPRCMSRKDAWVIVNSRWHLYRGCNEGIDKLDDYVGRLCDVLHELGATFMGSLVVLIIWLSVTYKQLGTIWWLPIVWLCLIVVLFFNYIGLMHDIENLVNTSLFKAEEDLELKHEKMVYLSPRRRC